MRKYIWEFKICLAYHIPSRKGDILGKSSRYLSKFTYLEIFLVLLGILFFKSDEIFLVFLFPKKVLMIYETSSQRYTIPHSPFHQSLPLFVVGFHCRFLDAWNSMPRADTEFWHFMNHLKQFFAIGNFHFTTFRRK